MISIFGKKPEQNINRPVSEKEQNLIMELRKLSSADVEIGLLDSQPDHIKLFNASFLDVPDDSEMTNEERMLLQILRYMKFGTCKIHVEAGQFSGELLPETHIRVKL